MSDAQELTIGRGRTGPFLAVSFGLIWALALPAWWSGQGLDWPWLGAVLPVMMLAPTFAVLVVATAALSAAVGVLHLDLAHLGALRESAGAAVVERTPGGVIGVLVLTMLQSAVLGTALTVPFAFGEEWGWRGWLQPELVARWGTTRGLVATGAIWGPWHAAINSTAGFGLLVVAAGDQPDAVWTTLGVAFPEP